MKNRPVGVHYNHRMSPSVRLAVSEQAHNS